jgi:hypothetical protein
MPQWRFSDGFAVILVRNLATARCVTEAGIHA